MLIVVIVSNLDIFEHCYGIVGERCEAEILCKQVAGYAKLVETHQTGRERRGYLTWNTCLMQTYDTLFLLAGAHKDDVCGSYATVGEILTLNLHLVARNDWHTAPQDHLGAEEVGCLWWNATPSALTLEGCYGTWMGHEERRALPNERQQCVEVVGSRRTVASGDTVAWVNAGKKTEVAVVDEFPLLAFLNTLDAESELLLSWLNGLL